MKYVPLKPGSKVFAVQQDPRDVLDKARDDERGRICLDWVFFEPGSADDMTAEPDLARRGDGMMDIKPIRNDEDRDSAMRRIEELWDAPDGSKEGDELEVLAILVEDYEESRMEAPAPVGGIIPSRGSSSS